MKYSFNTLAVVVILMGIIGFAGCEGPTGPQGEQGIQGPVGEQGEPGNANVKVFSLSVTASQWGQNLHYGDGNIYRRYDIPPEKVGGIDIREFFDDGGVVLAYVKGDGTNGYSEWKLTPHTYSLILGNNYIGVRVECIPSRGALTIARTTNGWNSLRIDGSEVPAKTDFRIVLIEATVFAQAKAEGRIDFSDYRALRSYFNLQVHK